MIEVWRTSNDQGEAFVRASRARDTEHSNAVVLKIHLEHILNSGP